MQAGNYKQHTSSMDYFLTVIDATFYICENLGA